MRDRSTACRRLQLVSHRIMITVVAQPLFSHFPHIYGMAHIHVLCDIV
ncbi:hypothetical protein F01_460640 [Burkholderia cenocepacia]|nr:hypothetical protein F01_460640 [Burkholderia cenocepacia]